MPRGRPLKTEIREKIASILAHIGQSYGYELYKYYQQVFGKINIRNLYYNIKKGLELGEFIIIDVKREVGSFTWGGETQHIYYTLGPYARTYQLTTRQKEILSRIPVKEVRIDWDKEIQQKIKELEESINTFKSQQSRMRYEEKTKFRSLIKHRTDMLKEWMRSKFDRNKAHELHVKLDLMYNQLNP
jgi:hypothetical protein